MLSTGQTCQYSRRQRSRATTRSPKLPMYYWQYRRRASIVSKVDLSHVKPGWWGRQLRVRRGSSLMRKTCARTFPVTDNSCSRSTWCDVTLTSLQLVGTAPVVHTSLNAVTSASSAIEFVAFFRTSPVLLCYMAKPPTRWTCLFGDVY